jgi:hypothetical protein
MYARFHTLFIGGRISTDGGLLIDHGFTSTIIPLVGDQAITRFWWEICSCREASGDRTFWILSPIAMIAFLAIMRRDRWSWICCNIL